MLNKIFRKQKTIHNVFFLCKTVYLCMNSTFTQLKKVIRRQQCNELKWLEPLQKKSQNIVSDITEGESYC